MFQIKATFAVSFYTENFFLTDDCSLTECTECTEFFRRRLKDRWLTLRVPSGFEFSPTDCTDNSDFNSSFSSIRSLVTQEVALEISTDFNAGEATASSV